MDNNIPQISVILPVYNVEKYIERCLDSILNQSFNDIEIVCVDDASPDDSAKILKRYAARHSCIRIVTKSKNEGLMMARRTGYETACGRYFFFCDTDDYLPPGTLEMLFNAAMESGADIIAGNFYFETDSGRKTLSHRSSALTERPEDYLRAIMSGTLCTLCGSLYARHLFEGKSYTTFLNHSMSEDRMLLTQLLFEARKIRPVAVPAYVYFRNGDSMTKHRLGEKKLSELLRALNWVWHFLKSRPGWEDISTRHYVKYLSFLIESGYDAEFIKGYAPENEELLRFSALRSNLGLRMAVHTRLSVSFPIYRNIMAATRRQIQKILGR